MRSHFLATAFLILASPTLFAAEAASSPASTSTSSASLANANSTESEESVLVRDPAAEEEPIELPPQLESGEPMDPEITIIKRGDKTVHEYRMNGELYMIKIIPSIGPAYYMVDTDGDGNMDVRRDDREKTLNVPQWVLFSWD